MAHRVIIDASGVTWEVWEVKPSMAENRETDTVAPPETTGERRRIRSVRSRLTKEMMGGWLAMKSRTERRRIAPVPPGWYALSDTELLSLIDGAVRGGPTRRLIE